MRPAPPEAAAPRPLLQTKLYAPRVARGLVDRPRLSELRDRFAGQPAARCCSSPRRRASGSRRCSRRPAGRRTGRVVGRGVAVVGRRRQRPRPSGPTCSRPSVRRRPAGRIRAGAPGVARRRRPIATVLTSLLNDLAGSDNEVVLVLDDYHVIDTPEIHEAMAFLVDHLPPQLRLVIATRSDPPLPLAAAARPRRARRGARRRPALHRPTRPRRTSPRMGLQLSADEVGALEGRTEGWVAALQLAALSLQGREDVAGVHRRLRRRRPPRRRLPRRGGACTGSPRPCGSSSSGRPCCPAVADRWPTPSRAGPTAGDAEALDRDNLFLVPLDDQRRWYRYHHLFADMLQARLLDELPGEAPELHRRASAWFEQEGDTTAGDRARARQPVTSIGLRTWSRPPCRR